MFTQILCYVTKWELREWYIYFTYALQTYMASHNDKWRAVLFYIILYYCVVDLLDVLDYTRMAFLIYYLLKGGFHLHPFEFPPVCFGLVHMSPYLL